MAATLEVCTDDQAGLQACIAGGADRMAKANKATAHIDWQGTAG